jgi:hypothetical protein
MVGAYTIQNPNHIRFEPWPVVAQVVAAGAAAALAIGARHS